MTENDGQSMLLIQISM